VEAVSKLNLKKDPILDGLAAVSVGVVAGAELLDLCYEEDSRAGVDMNVIQTASGKYIEVQGTAEGQPYDRKRLNALLDVAQVGLDSLYKKQQAAIDGLR
jgi:ribonuclease PH